MDVSPALDAVDALATLGGAADERPVLLLGTDEARLTTDTEVDQAPAHARELTTDRRPEAHLHLHSASLNRRPPIPTASTGMLDRGSRSDRPRYHANIH